MTTVKYPVILIVVFTWIGFVCAISFMEAWLKFQAPGITIPLGLGIGRLVFSALNKVEWVFAIVVIGNYLFERNFLWNSEVVYFLIPLFILLIQSFWLLPALDSMAALVIQGKNLPASNIHIYYVLAEVIKVVCLFMFGIKLFKK